MLIRNKGKRTWIVKFKHRGETVRISTGQTDRRRAEVEGRRLRVEHEQKAGPGGRRSGVTLAELAGEDVQRALAEGADMSTRGRTLKWIWTQVIKHLGDIDIAAIDYDRVLDYVGKRRIDGAKGQTIRRETQAIKRGLVMAKRRGWIGAVMDEWPKIKSDAPDEKQRGKLVSPEVLRLVLGELSGDVRDEAEFAVYTGLRHAEIKRVRAEWVEPVYGGPTPALLRIPAASAKTRTERIVGLSAPALDVIKRRLEARPMRELVFSQDDHKAAYRSACDRAGVQRVTLRDLRHTYATLALQSTSDAVAVQAALGHTDLRMTQRYQSSTVARTISASAGVAGMLAESPEGSPVGGHPEAKNSMGARSSCGQSIGLLSDCRDAHACTCCAERCTALHGISHTCEAQGSTMGVNPDPLARERFAFRRVA